MRWDPFSGSRLIQAYGTTTATSRAVSVATGGTPNTKTGWTQAVAATAGDTNVLQLTVGADTTVSDFLVDVAVGGAGSEQVIVSNWPVSVSTYTVVSVVQLPVGVPGGSRLAVRAQCSDASLTVQVGLAAWYDPRYGNGMRFAAYGTNTADSGGVSVASSGSTHTKGSWTEIVAATANPVRQLWVNCGAANAAVNAASLLVDVAAGGAGSEQTILANLTIYSNNTRNWVWPPRLGPFELPIPAGTRLAVRTAASVSSTALDFFLAGLD